MVRAPGSTELSTLYIATQNTLVFCAAPLFAFIRLPIDKMLCNQPYTHLLTIGSAAIFIRFSLVDAAAHPQGSNRPSMRFTQCINVARSKLRGSSIQQCRFIDQHCSRVHQPWARLKRYSALRRLEYNCGTSSGIVWWLLVLGNRHPVQHRWYYRNLYRHGSTYKQYHYNLLSRL